MGEEALILRAQSSTDSRAIHVRLGERSKQFGAALSTATANTLGEIHPPGDYYEYRGELHIQNYWLG
jgi:hypothetical protein